MPVLVGALLDEAFDGLGAGLGIAAITQLAGVGAKAAAEVALGFAHVRVGGCGVYRQRFQRRSCACFGDAARIGDGAFELPSD